MTLYQELQHLHIPIDNHYSDLYFPVTPQTRELVKKHQAYSTVFRDQSTNTLWYDVPFGYEPFWEGKVN